MEDYKAQFVEIHSKLDILLELLPNWLGSKEINPPELVVVPSAQVANDAFQVFDEMPILTLVDQDEESSANSVYMPSIDELVEGFEQQSTLKLEGLEVTDNLFDELPKPKSTTEDDILEKDLLGIKVTEAAHNLLDERPMLSPVDSELIFVAHFEERNGNNDSTPLNICVPRVFDPGRVTTENVCPNGSSIVGLERTFTPPYVPSSISLKHIGVTVLSNMPLPRLQLISFISWSGNESIDVSCMNHLLDQKKDIAGYSLGPVLHGCEVGQPNLLTVRSIKADDQLFDNVTERFPVEQRNGSANNGNLVLPASFPKYSGFKYDALKAVLGISSSKMMFGRMRFGEMAVFIFDPGRVTLPQSFRTNRNNRPAIMNYGIPFGQNFVEDDAHMIFDEMKKLMQTNAMVVHKGAEAFGSVVNEEFELIRSLRLTKKIPIIGRLEVATVDLISTLLRLLWYIELAIEGMKGVTIIFYVCSVLPRMVIMDKGSFDGTESNCSVNYIAGIYNIFYCGVARKEIEAYGRNSQEVYDVLQVTSMLIGMQTKDHRTTFIWCMFASVITYCKGATFDLQENVYGTGAEFVGILAHSVTSHSFDHGGVIGLKACTGVCVCIADWGVIEACKPQMQALIEHLSWVKEALNKDDVGLPSAIKILLAILINGTKIDGMLTWHRKLQGHKLVILAGASVLNNFVWDPGQDAIYFDIIEDNDVLKRTRIGIRLALALKQGEKLNGASAHMGLLACSLVERSFCTMLLITPSKFRIRKSYSSVDLLVRSLDCDSIDPNGAKQGKRVNDGRILEVTQLLSDKLPHEISLELNKEGYTIHVNAECWETLHIISLNGVISCAVDKLKLEEHVLHKNKMLWKYVNLTQLLSWSSVAPLIQPIVWRASEHEDILIILSTEPCKASRRLGALMLLTICGDVLVALLQRKLKTLKDAYGGYQNAKQRCNFIQIDHITVEDWLHTYYLSMGELCLVPFTLIVNTRGKEKHPSLAEYMSIKKCDVSSASPACLGDTHSSCLVECSRDVTDITPLYFNEAWLVVRSGNYEMPWSLVYCSKAIFFWLELSCSNVVFTNVAQEATTSKMFIWDPGARHLTTLRTRRLLRGRTCHDPRFKSDKYELLSVPMSYVTPLL